jgi:hypothetical protein
MPCFTEPLKRDDFLKPMQAIITKYFGPSNVRGARVKAMCDAGSITLSWDHSLDVEKNHHTAALKLCAKLGWEGKLASGGMPKAGYCYAFITRKGKVAEVVSPYDEPSFKL